MSFIAVWGWLCAVVGLATSLPQLVRLIKAHTSAGLSLVAWQLMLSANIGWAVHGLLIGKPNMWLPNAGLIFCTVSILRLIKADRHLGFLRTYGSGVLLGACWVSGDLLFGAVVFGMLALLPQVAGAIGQFTELVRREDLSGVSLGYLTMLLVGQVMWGVWGWSVPDPALIISTAVMGTAAAGNFTWYVLRTVGVLRPRQPAAHSAGVTGREPVAIG